MGGVMGKLGGGGETLRQRGGASGRVHPEPDAARELQEPLLATAEPAGAAAEGEAGPPVEPAVPPVLHPAAAAKAAAAAAERRRRRQAQHHGPLEEACQALLAAWRGLLGALWRLLGALLPALRAPPPLQADRLAALRARAAQPYDAACEEHAAALRALWVTGFPTQPFPGAGVKCALWRDMGWQGDDPGTDFRGGGLLSLGALVHMAQAQPDTFLHLMHKRAGVRSEWEYPFAAGGVNVAFMLAEMLELRRTGPPSSPPARAFVVLLEESESAFEELFVLSCRLLDATWLQMGATYMEFPQVLGAVRQRVGSALGGSRVGSLAELQTALMV